MKYKIQIREHFKNSWIIRSDIKRRSGLVLENAFLTPPPHIFSTQIKDRKGSLALRLGQERKPSAATTEGRGEPPEAMSLLYADTILPDLPGKPISTMQTKPTICRPCLRYAVNEPPLYSTSFYKSWFLCVMKNFNIFFWRSLIRILLKIRVLYWLSWLETYMDYKIYYFLCKKCFFLYHFISHN